MADSDSRAAHPVFWVPTSYMAMGFVLSAVTLSTNFAFKNLGLSNGTITALASVLTLPYVFKPFWAPLLEIYKTKKFWVLLTQFSMSVLFVLAGLALQLPFWLAATFGALMLTAILGATQDIGADGVYVTTLSPKRQAAFSGVQSMAWTFGPFLAAGVLVPVAGYFHSSMVAKGASEAANVAAWSTSWMYVFIIAGVFIAILGLWHSFILPTGGTNAEAPKSTGEAMATFGDAFKTFFQKKAIWRMIAVAYFYRFGIYLLEKVGNIFLIAERSEGGLGLTNEAAGAIIGGYGSVAFLAASILGGLFVSRTGLTKWVLLALCIMINVPNLTFFWLSYAMPDPESGYWIITAIVCIEKFGYGFGAVGHMLYMMQQIAPGKYKTAHYAFATGFMGLCNFSTGAISGSVQQAVGYQMFFLIVLIAATPAILAVWFAPFLHDTGSDDDGDPKKDADASAPEAA